MHNDNGGTAGIIITALRFVFTWVFLQHSWDEGTVPLSATVYELYSYSGAVHYVDFLAEKSVRHHILENINLQQLL